MEREQIGKAVLDYHFYTGEDKYTDGAIEDEMHGDRKKLRTRRI